MSLKGSGGVLGVGGEGRGGTRLVYVDMNEATKSVLRGPLLRRTFGLQHGILNTTHVHHGH